MKSHWLTALAQLRGNRTRRLAAVWFLATAPGALEAVDNETCSTATPIMTLPYMVTMQPLGMANDGPQCGMQANVSDVWWIFAPPSSGLLTLNTCGSNVNTVLSIFSGNDCVQLAPVACNNNCMSEGCPGTQQSCLTVPVAGGTIYHIRVARTTPPMMPPPSPTINLTLDCAPLPPNIRCVNQTAPPGGDGRCWLHAYPSLQEALSQAAVPGSGITEIWVATGIYMPDQGGGQVPGDRSAAFHLRNGVAVYGGFAGNEDPGTFDLANRDFSANETTLSGDLNNDDLSGYVSDNSLHVVACDHQVGASAVLDGLTIKAGNANGAPGSGDESGGGLVNNGGSPTVVNCRFTGNSAAQLGGGIYTAGGAPALSACSVFGNVAGASGGGLYAVGGTISMFDAELGVNTAPAIAGDTGEMHDTTLHLLGDLVITGGTLNLRATTIDTPDTTGTIKISLGAKLAVRGLVANAEETTLGVHISGPGDMVVDYGQVAQLTSGAVLDLSGEVNSVCTEMIPEAQAANWGTLTLHGKLLVGDGVLHFTKLDVINQASATTCDHPLGGELIATQGSHVECNLIQAFGDRYFVASNIILDPMTPPAAPKHNYVKVVATPDLVATDQGELVEVRGKDYDQSVNCAAASVCQLDGTSSGFTDDWALQRLELGSGARANLTNRAQNPMLPPEVLYVRDLVLGSDAVLNIGLQRLYYQTLTMGEGSQIVSGVPLLGFSLSTIEMDDECEFIVRVRTRTAGAATVSRIDAPVPNGSGQVMKLFAPASGDFAAAAGAFAPSTEDSVGVAFDYLFDSPSDSNTELIVYLRDTPSPDMVPPPPGVCNSGLCEVARIRVPDPDRAGSVGSGRFAHFNGHFPRGSLDLSTGSYVELRLMGPGAVYIDHWDPTAQCSISTCDLSGDGGLTYIDWVIALSAYGRSAATATLQCFEHLGAPDNYVGADDLATWDTHIVYKVSGCYASVPEPTGASVNVNSARLLVGGKDGCASMTLCTDHLYAVDVDGNLMASDPMAPPTAPPYNNPVLNGGSGRLVRDSTGAVYQMHTLQGPVSLATAQPILTSGTFNFGSYAVELGVVASSTIYGYTGVSLSDMAFGLDPSHVYVAPVRVSGAPYPCPILAAARLSKPPGANGFAIDRLYLPPLTSWPSCNSFPEKDYFHASEVELSPDGQRLYVVSAQENNDNDWLMVFDQDTAAFLSGSSLSGDHDTSLLYGTGLSIDAPTAMLAAPDNTLYLASGASQSTSPRIYRFSIATTPPVFTGALEVGFACVSADFGTITSMTRVPDGTLWLVGFSSLFYSGQCNPCSLSNQGAWARIPPSGVTWSMSAPSAAVITARPLSAPKLPLSALFVGSSSCNDLRDFALLQNCYSSTNPCDSLCSAADSSGDGAVGAGDIGLLASLMTGPCP